MYSLRESPGLWTDMSGDLREDLPVVSPESPRHPALLSSPPGTRTRGVTRGVSPVLRVRRTLSGTAALPLYRPSGPSTRRRSAHRSSSDVTRRSRHRPRGCFLSRHSFPRRRPGSVVGTDTEGVRRRRWREGSRLSETTEH